MIEDHEIVGHEAWLDARIAFLAKEKEFSRARDAISELRRALPWERVDKNYVFEGASGHRTLAELFKSSTQLITYHFMFAPEWETGCEHCSFWADSFNPNVVHLKARDVSFVAISRAPYAKLAAYKQRMGWSFDWLSSSGNDFSYDYHASFTADEQATEGFYNYAPAPKPRADVVGVSVFYRDGENIFHTYSTYARGVDLFNAAYNYLDVVPKGRGEDGKQPQYWVRRRDEYEA